MKIAVCVSGQLRGRYEECIPSWEKMFDPLTDEVDYFVHTWTNSTAPNKVAHANNDNEEKVHSNTELNIVKRLLKPKKILVEDPIDFVNRGKDQHECAVFDPNYHSQFYGVMMACHLKQQYEREFAMEYDLCVRMRFDNYVEEEYKMSPPALDITAEGERFQPIALGKIVEEEYRLSPIALGNVNVIHQTFDDFHRYRCSDVYWSAPSFDYDRICDFYSCIPKYKREWFDLGRQEAYGPEHVLSFHIKANHIKPKQTYMPIKLKREENHYSGGSHEIT